MFAHTAAKRRIANVAVLWAHQIKFDRARQNRTFAKRNLERDDCSARSAAQAERGEFPRKRRAALSRNSPRKEGKTAAERVGFSPQASEKSRGRKSSKLFHPHPRDFSLNSSAAKPHFCQALPLKCAVRIFRTSAICRTSEGGKSEFLRVRQAQDLDTLPQKERKPRLKKTIHRFVFSL